MFERECDNHDAVERQKKRHFINLKRTRREHSRQGCPEKTEDEAAKESKDHNAHVSQTRVKVGNVPKVERPEEDTEYPGEHGLWEEKPKWLVRGGPEEV